MKEAGKAYEAINPLKGIITNHPTIYLNFPGKGLINGNIKI